MIPSQRNADFAAGNRLGCFVRDIVARYPDATRITLVTDNLNTHCGRPEVR